MAIYQKLKPKGAELAIAVATGAFKDSRSQATARPGSVYIPNGDGTGTMLGPAAGTDPTGGSNGFAPFINDTTPPGRPVGISATSSGGVVVVSWGGELEGGVPADFAYVRVHARSGADEQVLGDLATAGSVSSGGYEDGDTVEVWGVAYDSARDALGNLSPNASDESEHIEVEVVDLSQQAMDIVAATGQHFWSDDNGVHVSTEEKVADGPSNIIMNALGILLRAAQNNLIAITEDGISIYDGQGNEAGNVIASFGKNVAQMGGSEGSNVVIDSDSVDIRNGQSVSASFSDDLIEIGKSSDSATVDFCNGLAVVSKSEYGGAQVSSGDDWLRLYAITGYDSGVEIAAAEGGEIMFSVGKNSYEFTNSFLNSLFGVVGNSPYVRSRSPSNLRVWTGSKVVTVTDSWGTVLNQSEIRSLLGRNFNQGTDAVFVMNGDNSAKLGQIMGAASHSDGMTRLYMINWNTPTAKTNGATRFQWMLIAP